MKYPITLKPQGAIARNLKMKIQLTPAPPEAEPLATITNVLNVGVADTLPAYTECTLVVFINEPLDGDLDVTVSVLSGDDVHFLNSDSPPEYTEIATTVTIPAGSYFATVPFETGSAQTGDVTVTATADGYADATGAFAIVCETVVDDVFITVEWQGLDLLGARIRVVVDTGSFHCRDPGDALGTTDNFIDIPIFHLQSIRVEIFAMTRGRLCPGDTFSWTLTQSGTGLMELFGAYSLNDVNEPYLQPQARFRALGDLYLTGTTISVGDQFVFTTKMNGVTVDNPRATFTINVVP